MGKKYHINPKTGVPTICRAKKGQCPYVGAFGTENHYDTYSEAQEAAFLIMRDEFGIVYDISADIDRNSIDKIIEDHESFIEEVGPIMNDDRNNDEIMRDLVNTDDNDKIMRVIDGLDYPDMEWDRVGAVLQNPNISDEFVEELMDYTDNFHLETIRLFVLNRKLSEEKVFEFASSPDDDMLARCIALRNNSVRVETAEALMETQEDIFSELPWSTMLKDPRFENLQPFKDYKMRADKTEMLVADIMNNKIKKYPDWWGEYGNY